MLRLVINLDRSPERLQRITTALKTFDLEFSRVRAVDGKLLTNEEVCQWTLSKPQRHLFFSRSYSDRDWLLSESSKVLAEARR